VKIDVYCTAGHRCAPWEIGRGLHEYIVDGEHFLQADAPNAFVAYTVSPLANADLRQRLADQARCLVEAQYDWSQIGARFVALVESAVEHARKGLA
jgi:glycosyltransferase involved in cell wall biosynthesis